MRIDFLFRVSTYVTLFLACVCVGHSEDLFLPSFGWFLLPLLLALMAAFYLEGRWALPGWVANLAVAGILAGSVVWIVFELRGQRALLEQVPLPAAIIPYVGPVVMLLLVVQLLRPKGLREYWTLHLMGLLLVGLGCVLAGDRSFGLLLAAYLLCALWCLALFYLHRGLARSQRPAAGRVPWRYLGLGRAAAWLAVAAAAAVLLAVVTPRLGQAHWDAWSLLGKAHNDGPAQTGYAPGIDLNRTGQVAVNDEVVFEVTAADAQGQPKLDLSPTQRWRGDFLDQYHNGRWVTAQPAALTPGASGGMARTGRPPAGMVPPGGIPRPEAGAPGQAGPRPPEQAALATPPRPPRMPGPRLPDLGPGQFILSFDVSPRKAGGLFLADPVQLLPEHEFLPVVTGPSGPFGALFLEHQAAVAPSPYINSGRFLYRQSTRPPQEPDLGPPVTISARYLGELRAPPSDSLQQWTDQLVRRLAAERWAGLGPDDGPTRGAGDGRRPVWEQREKLARALCDYLNRSGDYTYSLDLRRRNLDLDPTEDFLRNVREGNCDRYAGALALMLRAEDVPARVVKGYRGAEGRGDGTYLVRASDAHSWVEVLVARPGPDGRQRLHWLALDPTPSAEGSGSGGGGLAQWWESFQRFADQFWRSYVIDYGAEEQTALLADLNDRLAAARWWQALQRLFEDQPVLGAGLAVGAAAALGLGLWALRRAWRALRRRAQEAARAPSVRCYARLLALLARHCRLRPGPSQTAREFGAAAAGVLRGRPATAPLAELPGQVAALFYRVRFGGRELSAEEGRQMDQRLDQLAAALAAW